MDNNKLIQILETLSKKEWREFSKFVESPYFNTDKHCIRLLEILKKEFAKKGDFQLSRTRLEKLFSKNNAADASLLNVKLSLLTRLAEQFFAQQELEEKPLLSKHLLLKRLFKRGLNSHFESAYRRNNDLHESPEKVNAEDYLDKYLIQQDFLRYTMAADKKTFLANENLQDTNEALDVFYIVNKIDLYNRMSIIRKIFQKKYDMDSFQFVESMALLPSYTNHSIVRLYYALYMLQRSPSPESFNYLRETMREYISDLDVACTKGFYITAVNYCVYQGRKGESYDEETYEIFADMEAAGLLATREWTDIRTLQNVIVSGLVVKRFEWATDIIEKYKNKIEPSIRKSAYNYLLALCALYKKEFDEAIGFLLQARNIDFEFNMNIKSYLIRCYYERDTEYSEYTEQTIRSYKVFFKQNKCFSKQMKDVFINFGNMVHYLYRIKHNQGRVTIEDVSKKMEQYESMMYRDWLLEKIKELQNRPVRRTLC